MDKVVKLVSLAVLSGLVSSHIHYEVSILELSLRYAPQIKVVVYLLIFLILAVLLIFDDDFKAYFKSEEDTGVIAIIATLAISFFTFASYRAFTLLQPIEGYFLIGSIAFLIIGLLIIYIKLLLTGNNE